MKQTFEFAQGNASPVVAIAILVFALLLAGYFLYAPRSVRFEITPESLRIRGDLFYGRTIPVSEMRLEEARLLDGAKDDGYRLTIRTNGTGLPGYRAGWFRMANGEKALAFIGDRRRVVAIPVKSGYTLLLSAKEPQKLLQSLAQPASIGY